MAFGSNAFGWPYFGQDWAGNNLPPVSLPSSVKPRISLPKQILSITALDGFSSALVDDDVYLVDDPTILVGNQTTAIADIKIATYSNAPKVTIQLRH